VICKDSNPAIEILTPGILTTVQDRGRPGFQSLGIAESGAMDTFSFVAANRLAGNPDNSACLEITLAGPKIRFLGPTWGSLTGAHLSAHLNQYPLNPGRTFKAETGDLLSFGPRVYGMRAYLAVAGGFDVPVVLGSRSTYVYAGFGGHEGRPLRKGDILSSFILENDNEPTFAELPAEFQIEKCDSFPIHVIVGPHEDRFTQECLQTFFDSRYVVMSDSNRMGYRLKGPQITHRDTPIVVSEATPLGAVQVPGQGTPVILLRERGTTGGYTKIACVIRKDLDILGQILPGKGIFFHPVDLSAAHRLDRERWEALESWRKAR
jgi:antagonist of KipI